MDQVEGDANQDDTFMFVGPIIHSISLNNLEFISNGLLVVSEGKIVTVQKDVENSDEVRRRWNIKPDKVYLMQKGQFLIPGFIDTHIHAPQYPNVGLGYDLPLLQWLDTYTFPLEKKFSDEKYAEKVYDAVVRRTLAHGTTTANYYATIHKESSCILADLVKRHGQRAFIGKVNMNKNTPPDYGETEESSIQDTKDFIEYVLNLKSSLIKPVITPRFALSCDMNLMKGLGMLAAEYDLPIQTHVSENLEEIKQVKMDFPEIKNYVGVYETAGLVNCKTVLAHGIHLEPDELNIIKAKGAAISHCPNSNILLESGVCPVSKYLEAGVKVGLGSDCSGGNTCSILESIRQTLMLSIQASISKVAEKLSIQQVFYMATLGGAEAMGLGCVTGNFLPGKEFDAILIDMNNSSVLDLLDEYNLQQLFQKFIYLGNDQLMKKVFVASRIVKEL
ncbi:hypothetical protein RUM43_000442 [Polyplax serrata]|uniref:Guanine deaminase n=1 Tax=Polyplax serrata TaxID=468196 RepID=A0AAN8SCI9_POLSC